MQDIRRTRSQAKYWKKSFAKDISHKGLLSKIRKKTLKTQQQKITQLKDGQNI